MGITNEGANAILKEYFKKGTSIYLHSIRVAEYTSRACNKHKLDTRLGYCAGMLHDIGKGYAQTCMVNKDMHPRIGHDLLKRDDLEVAIIVLNHHQFQRNKYFHDLPPMREDLEKITKLLSFCDKYDTYRCKNNIPKNDSIELVLGEYNFGDYIDLNIMKKIFR